MKLTEFLNDDTCQILLAIIVGIVICYFIFGSCSTGCSRRDGFSVGGQKFNPPEQVNCVNRTGEFDCKSGGKMNFPTSEQIDCSITANTQNYVLGACCDDVGENCTGGISSCDAECYNALNTVLTKCPNNLPFSGIDDTFNGICVPDCNSNGYSEFLMDGGPLKDACGISNGTAVLDESTGLPLTCDTNCRDVLMPYYNKCKDSTWATTDPLGISAFHTLDEFNALCNGGNSRPTPTPTPVTVDPERLADSMFTDPQYSTIMNNLSASGINTGDDLNDYGIYPLVLHNGSFTPSVVFGDTQGQFTTVHLMKDGNPPGQGLILGSIAQAQASIFVSASNTNGQQSAIDSEMQEFCSGGGVYGDESGRIDPGAKMASLPTVEANASMCGMSGNGGLASLGSDVNNYRDAIESRINPLVNDGYAHEISGYYARGYKIPVAKVDTNYIDVSQMDPDTPGYVHIVINFPNGAPNSNGSSVADTSVAGSGGKYLVIMSAGLSDGSKMELAKQSPMDALKSLRELQYLIQKSQTDVTKFMDAQYDPYYSTTSGAVTCSDTGCSLGQAGTFEQVQQNVACGQAQEKIQTYGLMLVKLTQNDGSDDGYLYLTPDDLVRTTNLKVTSSGIVDTRDLSKTYSEIGNFFIFEHNGIKYVVPKDVATGTDTTTDVLASPECITNINSRNCCRKLLEEANRDILMSQHPDIWTNCEQILFSGNVPGIGVTPPPPPSTGGGGGGTGQSCRENYMSNTANSIPEDYECVGQAGFTFNETAQFNQDLGFRGSCCTRTCPDDSPKSGQTKSDYSFSTDPNIEVGCPTKDLAAARKLVQCGILDNPDNCCYCMPT